MKPPSPQSPPQRRDSRAHHHRADSSGVTRRQYTPIGALATLQRNLLIYGLGGVIIPFIGIKPSTSSSPPSIRLIYEKSILRTPSRYHVHARARHRVLRLYPSSSGASHKSASTTRPTAASSSKKRNRARLKVTGTKLYRPKIFPSAPLRRRQRYDAANSSGSNLGPTSQKLTTPNQTASSLSH